MDFGWREIHAGQYSRKVGRKGDFASEVRSNHDQDIFIIAPIEICVVSAAGTDRVASKELRIQNDVIQSGFRNPDHMVLKSQGR